ncbi:MAG: HAMP domain-containing histidine kinase [Dechloromonas sp.]|uniref:histidine kinase n=1 Tax=Candidatus Dechloromonas phosphorivorans TaxID=2899244 RepID=A0A9D7LS44_9RHOO|nr:HAMP domain-containing histidine kinase [Candidatus Dechloromonas phosphorivorans]
MNQVSTLSPQELQEAFQVFTLASSDLCLAYEELRQEGERLTQELALANGELRRQFEAREAERESRQRQERLAAMGEMAARLAHQLRTPLATALLYAAQLGGADLPATERERFASKTVERLHHLERLVNDMLQFVRGVHAGCEPSAVEDMLSEAFQIIEPQAMARGLLAELCDESGGCVIHVDRQALGGALLSLLENAVQACNAGGSIRLAASVANGQVAFCVSDTGAGIAAALQEHLFEPFFTTRRGGTGLGLAIVRSVAETHGGSISLRSVPGEGSEFRLCLPVVPEPGRALSG